MAWEGRFLVIGFASGEIPRLPLNLVLLKGCQVVGVFLGSFTGRDPERHRANIGELLAWLAEGKIRPHVSAAYPLEQAGQAIADLGERRAQGKIVVIGALSRLTRVCVTDIGDDRRFTVDTSDGTAWLRGKN